MDCRILIDEKKQTLKGNLHTHTSRLDGKYNLRQITELYQSRGYDFLAITDHNCSSEDLVADISPGNLVLIPGLEASCDYCGQEEATGAYCHFLCLGRKEGYAGAFQTGTYRDAQDIQSYLNQLNKQFRIVQINHPLFSKLPDSDWICLDGYHLLEVYNQKDYFVETGEENAGWLARTLMNHGRKFFVTASDDFHGPIDSEPVEDCIGGFVMVQSEKTAEAILQAIENGNFYASTGPLIHHYALEDQQLRIKTSEANRILFCSNLRRCKHVYSRGGSPLTEAVYQLTGNEKYVWTKVIDAHGNTAWTQPIFFE